MDNTEKKDECKFTFKCGEESITLKAFQSPRAIRFNEKRPNYIIIDCYQGFDVTGLLKFSKYLQELAFAMEFKQ